MAGRRRWSRGGLLVAVLVACAAAQQPSTTPFDVVSSAGRLVARPLADPSIESPLHIKGALWMGMQAAGCPRVRSAHTVASHIAFMATHFNAVITISERHLATARLEKW